MLRCSRLVVLVLVVLTAGVHAQERGLQPEDFYKEVVVQEVAVSPDGSLIAFTRMSIDQKENKRHREIWMVAVENSKPAGEPFRFTSPVHESRSPRWSPDGKLLSFSSRRGDDKNSIWFARVTAPGGEAFHIDGVEGTPVWSPDGQWIAFSKTSEDENGDKKKDKREGWIAPDALTNTLDAERFDGRVITAMRYKRDGTLSLRPHPSTQKKSQLFVVSASGGEAKQITDLPFGVSGIEWTADSSAITFTGNPQEDDEHNTVYTRSIYIVPRDGGEPKAITGDPGNESSQKISPDGAHMAYRFSEKRGEQTDLMLDRINPDGTLAGKPRNLTAEWKLSPGAPEWSADGKQIYFTAGDHGSWHLFGVDVDSGSINRITSGERRIFGVSFDRKNSIMAFGATDQMRPAELFIARADGSAEKRITKFNDAWLAEIKLREPEHLTWKVADGTEVDGWLLKPIDYDPNKKYPMILKIHGGPHSAYGNYWFRTFHILSNSGFFVLYPNPRGSGTYGHAFQYATRGKWGEMDSEDFFTGIDTAMAKYPQIDGERLGVSGGSYGGFMTNWLTATTDRFAAAVTSRSIVSWETWYGTSEAQGLTEYEFYGKPWEQRELYRKLSPISYVENVTAPTLIIHSEADHRTPIADGEMWYMALKKRKVPVEMARYPRSSHGLSRTGEPWLLVDRLERLRTWFVHWLITKQAKE